jgi:ribonuclease Z
MTPSFHPMLVNGRFGDPALHVGMLHRRGALLFDLGDLGALPARDLLRVTHVFVSHMHIDHLIGFDALLRVSVGRDRGIAMVGPEGFIDRICHKLHGYEWDLVDRYDADLVFDVTEFPGDGSARRCRMRFKNRFGREAEETATIVDGQVARAADFAVTAAVLEHHGPCLGFALAEPAHVNVWKNRLAERGLAPGPWLQALKRAVLQGAPDDTPIALTDGGTAELGELRDVVTVGAGQKIAYVTDVADTDANRRAIAALAEGADTLFIEARFAAADRHQAQERAHLTTTAAGEIARAAGARRVEPFHFSPRYEGEEARMIAEVRIAFGEG